jgi:hypothetical protein
MCFLAKKNAFGFGFAQIAYGVVTVYNDAQLRVTLLAREYAEYDDKKECSDEGCEWCRHGLS